MFLDEYREERAVERGESLPEPIRDKVIERERFAMKPYYSLVRTTTRLPRGIARPMLVMPKRQSKVRPRRSP